LTLACCCSSEYVDESQCVELTEREYSVCDMIFRAKESISFSQLKRATELHQEILSRIIRRLTVYGVVKKAANGRYRRARL
jgi:DNA-binding HxlR family transcriptional regulator